MLEMWGNVGNVQNFPFIIRNHQKGVGIPGKDPPFVNTLGPMILEQMLMTLEPEEDY